MCSYRPNRHLRSSPLRPTHTRPRHTWLEWNLFHHRTRRCSHCPNGRISRAQDRLAGTCRATGRPRKLFLPSRSILPLRKSFGSVKGRHRLCRCSRYPDCHSLPARAVSAPRKRPNYRPYISGHHRCTRRRYAFRDRPCSTPEPDLHRPGHCNRCPNCRRARAPRDKSPVHTRHPRHSSPYNRPRSRPAECKTLWNTGDRRSRLRLHPCNRWSVESAGEVSSVSDLSHRRRYPLYPLSAGGSLRSIPARLSRCRRQKRKMRNMH